jgi:hypothetical protein
MTQDAGNSAVLAESATQANEQENPSPLADGWGEDLSIEPKSSAASASAASDQSGAVLAQADITPPSPKRDKRTVALENLKAPRKEKPTPYPEDPDPLMPRADAPAEEKLAWFTEKNNVIDKRRNWLRANMARLSASEISAHDRALCGEVTRLNSQAKTLKIIESAESTAGAITAAREATLRRLELCEIVPEDGE